MIERANKLSWRDKTKYVVLTTMAKEGLSEIILSVCQDTPKSILLNVSDSTIENLCSELYEVLMLESYSEDKVDLWIQTWIGPLISINTKIIVPLPVLEKWVRSIISRNKNVLLKIVHKEFSIDRNEKWLQVI